MNIIRCVGILVSTVSLFGVSENANGVQPAPQSQTEIEVITNSIGMKLALIPAGGFTMGSPRSEDERIAVEVEHEVVITQPFYMGIYEASQSEFAEVMGRQIRAVFRSNDGGLPMENLEWKDAVEFCRRLSARADERRAGRTYRLPTEAEWEYACRAGTSTPFSFGESLSSTEANFNGNYSYGDAKKGPYLRKTAKVGSYPSNAFGLYDMHGNVAEWCADWYDADYYQDSSEEDPLGPPFGVASDDFGNFFLVVRGGSWLDDARALRSANRQRAMHRNRYGIIGFRVVCDVVSENP